MLTCGSHKYQQLPLIPVENFLEKFPEHKDDDENTLMFARIDHERTEREALEQQRQELLKRKQKLIADNKRRKEDLANLDNELEKFIDVCYAHPREPWNKVLTMPTGCKTNSEALREGSVRLFLLHHTMQHLAGSHHTVLTGLKDARGQAWHCFRVGV